MSEAIPVIRDLNQPEGDDVTVFIEIDDPSEEDLMRLYRTYREGGGEPYEPYESTMREQDQTAAA
jgi:hypothetical protein